MRWQQADDQRSLYLDDSLISGCEEALTPDCRVGDDPDVVAVMSPARIKASNAVSVEDVRRSFEWIRPSCLLLTSTVYVVTGRSKSFGRAEAHAWITSDYPEFYTGKWLRFWMIEMLGRDGGSLTLGFEGPGEMESMATYLRTR